MYMHHIKLLMGIFEGAPQLYADLARVARVAFKIENLNAVDDFGSRIRFAGIVANGIHGYFGTILRKCPAQGRYRKYRATKTNVGFVIRRNL